MDIITLSKSILDILNDEQIEFIKSKLNKGGMKK